MIGNMLISIGGLCCAILLLITYYLKGKQTKINNKIYLFALFILILVIISEITAITVLYNFTENVILGNIFARINSILTITWIMVLCCYLMTLGKGYKLNIKEYIKKDRKVQLIMLVYLIILILSFFFKFENVTTSFGSYIAGPALYFLYIAGFIAVFISIIVIARNKEELPEFRKISIFIGVVIAADGMVLQVSYPFYLLVTGTFVFEMYLLYFLFENPDLYLIKELEVAKRRAEESNRTKTEFLSNMSHEIRTPMNAIMGFSEGVLNEKYFNPQEVKKDISHIHSAGNNLLEIINNILDISKIETGEEKLELKEYNLANTVLELKSIIETRISSDKVKFITNIDENIPRKLIGDKTKIFQILLNVLSNSVKYTEVGRITLTINCEEKGSRAQLLFKISDTGFGIKKEDYQKLFEKFSRLENATQKEIEGTGLGLAITKRLVSLMGGNIWFESEYGAGTHFFIEIQQRIADSRPIGNILTAKREIQNQNYLDCTGYKVLLVDDSTLNLKVAERILSPYKFTITTLNDGKSCVDNIKEGNEYDMIFLDHMMPNMDGIQVLHILHKLEGYNIPPIVALTANAITGNKEMYLKEGFDEYLPKPINIAELDKLINKYFNQGEKRNINNIERTTTISEPIQNDSEKLAKLKDKGIDVEAALSYVGDMRNFNDMLQEFYKEIDAKIDKLEKCKNNNDIKNYSILVHSLKSDCRFLGINNFADIAFEHEKKSKEGDVTYVNDHFNEIKENQELIKKEIKEYLNNIN